MSVVYTESKCRKCEKVVKREGDYVFLPEGWGELTMVVRDKAEVIKQENELDLCPSCTRETLKILGVPRKRDRKAKEGPSFPDTESAGLPSSQIAESSEPGPGGQVSESPEDSPQRVDATPVDVYADGYCYVDDGTGEGREIRIPVHSVNAKQAAPKGITESADAILARTKGQLDEALAVPEGDTELDKSMTFSHAVKFLADDLSPPPCEPPRSCMWEERPHPHCSDDGACILPVKVEEGSDKDVTA